MRRYSPARRFASAADWATCRALLRGGSRTFFAASLVLPANVRRSATGLYAFCRMADDAIDQGGDRLAALENLRGRLRRLYAGIPDDIAADRAFAEVVLAHDIPQSFPDALLEGFEWDASNRRYETLAELNAYAVRVAGVVGAMMAMVMGVREVGSIARACDLGVAMQLTNIARDVGEDARHGRLYLPLEWLREAQIDPCVWSGSPVFNDGMAAVIQRLLDAAEDLYSRSEAGLAKLPAACRPGMYAARRLYAEIGHELRRRDLDSVNHRAVVSWQRKTQVLAVAVMAAVARSASAATGEILPQAGFLLAALPMEPRQSAAAVTDAAWFGIGNRVVWVADLFARLERLDRHDRSVRIVPDLS